MYRAIWAAIDDAYDNAKLEYDELIDLRDRVVILGRLHGRGRHTGIPVDQPISQVFTFERGLVVRQQDFAARERVIQAVGPSE